MSDYNGWASYETWNVALWIQNEEGLYQIARRCRNASDPYRDVLDYAQLGGGQTPDGVAWMDPEINQGELNNMIAEL